MLRKYVLAVKGLTASAAVGTAILQLLSYFFISASTRCVYLLRLILLLLLLKLATLALNFGNKRKLSFPIAYPTRINQRLITINI